MADPLRAGGGRVHGAAGPVHRQRRGAGDGTLVSWRRAVRPVLGAERLRDRVRSAAGARLRLADHFGRRRFLLGGVVVFTAGSVVCAVAPSLDVLVLGRLFQAVGAASIVPASLGLLLPTFPARQHNLVVGAWAGVAAVAASSGAPLGGLLVSLSWRWIFLVNVPIGIFTIALGIRVLPEVRAHAGARLPDTVSMLSLLAAVTLLIFGTVEGSTWGWDSPGVIASLAGAVAAGTLTVRRAFTRSNAVVEADLFKSREFGTASAALFLFFIAFATLLLISVLYLQDMWHYSALDAGLGIAPGPLTAAVFAINSGRISTRFGRAIPALLGATAMALSGLYWLLFATASPDYLLFLPGMVLGGVGAGLTQAPLFASAATLTASRATTGSAVLNMARQVGSAVGVAVLVALMASPHPEQLRLFDRGWALQFGAAAAAAIVLLVQGVLRPARACSDGRAHLDIPALGSELDAPAPPVPRPQREPQHALAG